MRIRPWAATAMAACLALLLAAAGPPAPAGAEIGYRTYFQDPGAIPHQDLSLENHAVELINATGTGERITFAFRDFNRRPVADALVAAQTRGVQVDGLIDGGERNRTVVRNLKTALGDHLVVCGSLVDFDLHSCIATGHPVYSPRSLMHNKFMTFSKTGDRTHVVLQTSMNFLGPNQLSTYNDMVEITGDTALYDAYVQYALDLRAQVRSDDRYVVTAGDGARNVMYPSPRPQPDLDTDDTIVDRMNDIDCSEGGSADGRGLIRAANQAFRSERAVIMRKLIELREQGCDIEVIVSNADGDILAGLVSAGIPVYPFFLQAIGTTRPEVRVHNKFWTVDARGFSSGVRERVTYAGSSNWRADEQYSDDLLLRMLDDGVYADYLAYWELVKGRAAVTDPERPAEDTVAPASAGTIRPAPNGAGWNRTDVTLRVAASDGHNVDSIGLQALHVSMSGAQSGSWEFEGETNGYSVKEIPITAEGVTQVTFWAVDAFANRGQEHSLTVRIDKTPPVISGLPGECELWPPNGWMLPVADVSAQDLLSGLAGSVTVSAASGEAGDSGDIAIDGGTVSLRAKKGARAGARTYSISASASDVAGNSATDSGACVVPHSQGS